jgi:hypothetical protein
MLVLAFWMVRPAFDHLGIPGIMIGVSHGRRVSRQLHQGYSQQPKEQGEDEDLGGWETAHCLQ